MRKKICWFKWDDPLKFIIRQDNQVHNLDDDEEFEEARDGFSDISFDDGKPPQNIGPVLVGPQGLIPLFERNIPSKTYNFWMGHANFRLTTAVADRICTVPGVEDLTVFSRYRFRLCVGKAFEDHIVRAKIDRLFVKRKKSKRTLAEDIAFSDGPDKIQMALLMRYKYWAVIRVDPLRVDYAMGDTRQEVEDQLQKKSPTGVGVFKSYH